MGKFGDIIDALCVMRIPKQTEIKDRQIGGLFRFLQFCVLVYIALSMWQQATWAYSEGPQGAVNAWPEDGTWKEDAEVSNFQNDLAYCGNPEMSYAYDESFVMDDPVCERHHPYEVTVKAQKRVEFVSAFIEKREVAWPTGSTSDASNTQLCTKRGGTLTTNGAQRLCESHRTVYPVGVDKMVLAFEHAYMPANPDASEFAHMKGGSNTPVGEEGETTSYIMAQDGTHETSESGKAVRKSLREWLALGGIKDINQPNTNLTGDYRDPAKFPPFRSAGVALDILIQYYNTRGFDDNEKDPDNTQVHAIISTTASTNTWAGNGPATHYETYPHVDPTTGAVSYDKVFKYRQGVIVNFRTTGMFYKMQWVYIIVVFTQGLVLLASAQAAANFFAITLHPKAKMMRNASISTFTVANRLAEIGMKGALGLLQFEHLDVDHDREIQMWDLVRTYARIKGVTFEQACSVAHLVIKDAGQLTKEMKAARQKLSERASAKVADEEGGQAKNAWSGMPGGDLGEKDDTIDFGKFLSAREGGAMIPWSKYLLLAEEDAKDYVANMDAETRKACEEAFASGQKDGIPKAPSGADSTKKD